MSAAPTTHSVRSTTGTGNSRKRENKSASRVGVWVVEMPVSAGSAFLFSVGFSSATDIFSLLLYLSSHLYGSQERQGPNLGDQTWARIGGRGLMPRPLDSILTLLRRR